MTLADSPPALDVSRLRESGFGSRTALWWGNTLLLFIETVMFALLAATYFYLQMNFQQWPPVQPHTIPPLARPLPDLPVPTIILVLQLLGCGAMALAHRAALQLNGPRVRLGMILALMLGIASAVLRFREFPGLHVRWDENAYGSITWMILGTHLLHLLAVTLEIAVLASYILFRPLHEKRALDVTLVAIYWYWTAGMWVIFYLLIYGYPRWIET
jgi:heme/copper-type cytochrome/quinol oxidase subunit 3